MLGTTVLSEQTFIQHASDKLTNYKIDELNKKESLAVQTWDQFLHW